MKRPMLVSGTAIGLSTALLVLFGTGALPILLLGAVSVFIIYFIKRFNLRDKIIIPAICISVFLSCIFFSAYHFSKIVPATRFDNTIADISGKIITTPQETTYGTKFILKTDKIGSSDKSMKIQVSLNNDDTIDLKLYDYISIPNTKLTVVRNEYNKPDPSSMGDSIILEAKAKYANYLWDGVKTPYYYCLSLKEIITEQINSYLPEHNAGLISGMLFGDKAEIDSDITNDFRATGIAHLLAVSGLHTSAWCGYIIAFLKLFKAKEKTRNFFCLLFLALLCIVSAFTPSVIRASIMMAVLLMAPFFKERQDPLNSLGFAVAILVLQNPYIITSVSFLLSVSATAGVMCSIYVISKIKIKVESKKLKAILGYLTNNLLTSAFAGLFTLPFSAYFFGVFSILSPIANLICVKPAFWSLLTSAIATIISFIPFNIPQIASVLIFKISGLLADLVTGVADFMADFRFPTLPIHKEYFLLGAIIIAIISAFTFIRFKSPRKKSTSIISASLCALIFSFSIIFPCTSLAPSTLYITNVGNGANVTLRQGLKYAHFNCGASEGNVSSQSLPKAKCESLDFLFAGKSDTTTNSTTAYLSTLNPQTTVITEAVKNSLSEDESKLPDNTIIANSYTHNFSKEITVHIVDTYPASCVIIKGSKKTAYISYGDDNDFEALSEVYGKPDILILSEYTSQALPENVEAVIISSDSNVILNKNYSALKNQTERFYTTAENGDIKIIL